MKKAIFLGLFLTLAVPFTSFAAFDSNLKYGSSGSAVTELQEFLADQGVYSGPITGNFYSLTLAGVKAFQSKESISPVSGYWGPLSRAKATTKLDLSVSDDAEKTETGTVTAPVVSQTPQPVVIVTPPTTVASTPVVVTPVEVKFDYPFGSCGIFQNDHNTTYAGIGCSYTNKGDKVTFAIDGIKPVVETIVNPSGKYQTFSFGVEPGTLIPDTQYSYTVKLERGNEYAQQSGTFKTKAE